MMIIEGVKLRCKMTGAIFEVNRIEDESVVLESDEGANQEWIDMGCLPFFFEAAANNEMVWQ